ncbi:MAG TPA: FAD-binding oxidoreductase [Deltaproteobacteria bacterium]|nr:FAD-binding oxidoreductase [Deltaproteobacteria bacterium]
MSFDLIRDPEILAGYLTDASNVRGHAEALVRPHTAAQIVRIVRHCQETATPLTVTAARTSTTAAPVPQGGWLLSMEALDRIEAIEHDHAIAQGGVRLGALQDAIEARGRLYPPDPTSRRDCTLGASIATNASGARSFRYGPTRPWVTALQVVLPTGELLEVDRDTPVPDGWPLPSWPEPRVKTAAGYAPARTLLDLFIGQEGTLGIITRATVRLTELPASVFALLGFFPSRDAAVAFVQHARASARADPYGPLSPRCLEYLDHHCLALAAGRVGGIPEGARAALFCEQEIYGDEDDHLEAWLGALSDADALIDDTLLANDPPTQARLHALRHAIPAGINERVVHNGMPKVGTDLAVPDDALIEMMEAYEAAPLPHVLFGHVGDNHLHLNLLPRNLDELQQARAYYDELARRAIALGGTVSAEHGIGKLKRHQLAWMVGPQTLAGFHRLKVRLDPAEILGRGNILAPSAGL